MKFILLKEIKDEKEFKVWINLEKVTKVYKEVNNSGDKCFRIFFSDDNSVLVSDNENHLKNALFKNKAKE